MTRTISALGVDALNHLKSEITHHEAQDHCDGAGQKHNKVAQSLADAIIGESMQSTQLRVIRPFSGRGVSLQKDP